MARMSSGTSHELRAKFRLGGPIGGCGRELLRGMEPQAWPYDNYFPLKSST